MHIVGGFIGEQLEGSTEQLRRGFNANTDIKYRTAKYEILLIYLYAFNHQLK